MTELRQRPTSSRGKHDDGHVRCANCGERTSDPRGVVGAVWCPACREARANQSEAALERQERRDRYAKRLEHNRRLHEQAQQQRPRPKPATPEELAQYGL